MADFSCVARKIGEAVVLEIGGEIDMGNADMLVEQGRPFLTDSARLVLDVGGITFLDSSGLRALLELLQAAAEAGASLTLMAPSDPVLRVLELSGTREVFTVVEDLTQAVMGDVGEF